MVFLYIFLVLVSAFPLVLTIYRMRNAAEVRKNGIFTDAFVTGIRTIQIKNSRLDIVTFEYKERITGRNHAGKTTTASGKHRYGDRLTVAYLPSKPSVYTVEGTKQGYIAVLIFCILLFLFVLFAIYKIDEMVTATYG